MAWINIIADCLSEWVKQDIENTKKQNIECAKRQIESIMADSYSSDATKEYLVRGVLQKLEQEQSIQSLRDFLLIVPRGLNEASKFTEQMANKQEK